jgi:hypothetical protein
MFNPQYFLTEVVTLYEQRYYWQCVYNDSAVIVMVDNDPRFVLCTKRLKLCPCTKHQTSGPSNLSGIWNTRIYILCALSAPLCTSKVRTLPADTSN